VREQADGGKLRRLVGNYRCLLDSSNWQSLAEADKY
jgi:hypothetical protein